MSFAPINQSGSQDVIAAQAGKTIVVESYQLAASGAITVKFQSKNSGTGALTDLTGPMTIPANGNLNIDSAQQGLFATLQGEGLTVSATGGVLGGHIRYSLRG